MGASAITAPVTNAQVAQVPIALEQIHMVVDQFKEPLDGLAGDLVHVLAADDGIYPPEPSTGAPHPSNPVIFTTKVGAGIFTPEQKNGRFVTAINPRPARPFFIRVYNAPAGAEATFYDDSEIFIPSAELDIGFFPELSSTTNPINPALSPDGLTVSLKESLGMDPSAVDTDGDGVTDIDELRMGTVATDPYDHMPDTVVAVDALGRVTADWALPVHQPVESIPLMSVEELNQRYAGTRFELQGSPGLLHTWSNLVDGVIGFSPWPPSMPMIDPRLPVNYYRLMIESPAP